MAIQETQKTGRMVVEKNCLNVWESKLVNLFTCHMVKQRLVICWILATYSISTIRWRGSASWWRGMEVLSALVINSLSTRKSLMPSYSWGRSWLLFISRKKKVSLSWKSMILALRLPDNLFFFLESIIRKSELSSQLLVDLEIQRSILFAKVLEELVRADWLSWRKSWKNGQRLNLLLVTSRTNSLFIHFLISLRWRTMRKCTRR